MSEQIEHSDEQQQGPSPVLMQRIIAAIVLGVAFLVLGSVFAPADSSAATDHSEHSDHNAAERHGSDESGSETPGAGHSPASEMPTEAWGEVTLSSNSTDPHEGLAVLGSLESANYRTVIYSTEYGPRYSVFCADEAAPLAVLLDQATLAKRFPDLPAADLAMGDVTQLMYVDPDDSMRY